MEGSRDSLAPSGGWQLRVSAVACCQRVRRCIAGRGADFVRPRTFSRGPSFFRKTKKNDQGTQSPLSRLSGMRRRRRRFGLIDGPRGKRHHQPGHEISKECRDDRHGHQYQQHPDNPHYRRINFEIFGDPAADPANLAVNGRPHQTFGHARRFRVPRTLPCAAEVTEIRVFRDLSLAISAMHKSDLLAPEIRPHIFKYGLDPRKVSPAYQYAARSRTTREMSLLWGRIASSSPGWYAQNVSVAATRRTGASNSSNSSSAMRAAISAP